MFFKFEFKKIKRLINLSGNQIEFQVYCNVIKRLNPMLLKTQQYMDTANSLKLCMIKSHRYPYSIIILSPLIYYALILSFKNIPYNNETKQHI